MIIKTLYDVGDIVYLKTDPDQLETIICKIICSRHEIFYGLAQGATFSEHYDIEMSSQKDIIKELNISGSQKI